MYIELDDGLYRIKSIVKKIGSADVPECFWDEAPIVYEFILTINVEKKGDLILYKEIIIMDDTDKGRKSYKEFSEKINVIYNYLKLDLISNKVVNLKNFKNKYL